MVHFPLRIQSMMKQVELDLEVDSGRIFVFVMVEILSLVQPAVSQTKDFILIMMIHILIKVTFDGP
jgi:hypothetical protein